MEISILKKHYSRIGFALVAGMLVSALLGLFFIRPLAQNTQLLQKLAQSLGPSVLYLYIYLPNIVGMFLIYLLVRDLPSENREKKKMQDEKLMRIFAAMYTAAIFMNMIGVFISERMPGSGSGQLTAISSMIRSGTLTGIVIPVFIGPVLEELLFRKLLLDRTRFYGEKSAIVLTALCFGLYHGNLTQFLYAFTVGLFLGYVYCRTARIFYTILMHVFLNGLSSMLVLVTSSVGASSDYSVEFILIGIFILIITTLVLGVIYLFRALRHGVEFNEPGEEAIPKGQVLKTIYANPGMLLMIFLSVMQILLDLLNTDLLSLL